MRIALAQLNYHVGNFDSNREKIIAQIERAKKEGADLVVFSELSVCGYYPQDLLEKREFIEKAIDSVDRIAKHCTGIAVLLGAPSLNHQNKGKKLHNSAYFIEDGEVKQVFHKTLLPTYDVFDEYRHFEPNQEFSILNFKGQKIAVTICEDIWDEQPTSNSFARERIYSKAPLEELSKQQPDLIVNLSASPFSFNQEDYRKDILLRNASKHETPMVYVNQVGANTEIVFDGGSMFVDSNGDVKQELKYFDEDFRVVDTNCSEISVQEGRDNYIAKIHDALVLGVGDYFRKTGFKQATLGLSGGIDSAVVAVLAQRALGPENVRVLLMPSKYSSDHSVKDAEDLAKNLNIQYEIVNIQPIVNQFEKQMQPLFEGLSADVTEENIQARTRGTLVMALSNKFGHILLNTTNKSECAVGYGTLYGDMNGGIAVLGDVYKSDVFKLARFMNKDGEVIPENTIVKPPSAELRPDQKDTDSLPDYDILDGILYRYIELNQSPDEIVAAGFDSGIVNKTIRMVNNNEYKRFQCAPILRISSKAFGFGRMMPLVAKYPI